MDRNHLSRRGMLKVLGGGAVGAWMAGRVGPAAPATAQQATLRLMTWGGAENAQKRDAALRAAYPERPDGTTALPFRRVFAVGRRAG